jgi:hypothetical protein
VADAGGPCDEHGASAPRTRGQHAAAAQEALAEVRPACPQMLSVKQIDAELLPITTGFNFIGSRMTTGDSRR